MRGKRRRDALEEENLDLKTPLMIALEYLETLESVFRTKPTSASSALLDTVTGLLIDQVEGDSPGWRHVVQEIANTRSTDSNE